jgi:hypothetical protein
MSTIHLRKLIAVLVRENAQRDAIIDKLEERIGVLEDRCYRVIAGSLDYKITLSTYLIYFDLPTFHEVEQFLLKLSRHLI